MKKVFIILIFLSVSIISESQRLPLKKMIEMNGNNWEVFNTYLLSQGYEYFKTDTSENAEARTYTFGIEHNKYYYFITKSISKVDSTRKLTIETVNWEDYYYYGRELKEYKFLFVKSQTEFNSTIMEYKKGNLELWLSTITNMIPKNKKSSGYVISIKTE